MYIIDFDSLDSATMSIQEPGTCANRNGATRAGSWADNWLYSADTDRGVDLGYGAYVGNRYWDFIPVDDGNCSAVKWTGRFSWYDLANCTNFAGDKAFTDIVEDTKWFNMTGLITVNLVSPLDRNSDYGVYSERSLCALVFVVFGYPICI